MARGPRKCTNMFFYHIMVQGINKEYILNEVEDKRQYLKFINKVKKEIDVYIVSYCIMDNHVHILIKEEYIECLSRFMHKVNTLYAMYYNKKYNRVGYVFRDRYKSQVIYSEKQLYTCINYIHNNPVKAGICRLASEYEYSSYNEYIKNMEEIQRNINGLLIKEDILDKKENFLEIEEEKEVEIKKAIEEYMKINNINFDTLKNERKNLKEIINMLKEYYGLSLRQISIYINVGRETVRNIAKELK